VEGGCRYKCKGVDMIDEVYSVGSIVEAGKRFEENYELIKVARGKMLKNSLVVRSVAYFRPSL
jgi:hypothetical protein